MPHADGGEEAVAEVRLGRGACADRRPAVPEQIELRSVRVRRMHDRGVLAEAAAVGEELDRAHAVLGEGLLELTRLLVRVDVERESFGVGVAAELDEPLSRTGTHRVGGDPDRDPSAAERLELLDVGRDGRLPHALEPAARVRHVEAHEADPGRLGCLGGGESRVEAEVVELADGREARCPHLTVRRGVELEHRLGRLRSRLREHSLAPCPEVAAGRPSAKGALERVAVGVDKPGQRRRSRHGRRH